MQKIIFILLILLPLISATCNENQININNASIEDLDQIYGIGPIKAQEIIDSRPFQSLNNLLNVSGIGQSTFDKIIGQGLVCIMEKNTSIEKVEQEEQEKKSFPKKEKMINFSHYSEPIIQETIYLNPKTIKTENSNQTIEDKGYGRYFIVIFCILLLSLYIIKPQKKKNEWQ